MVISNRNLSTYEFFKNNPLTGVRTSLHAFKTNLFPPNFVQVESTTKCNMRCKQCLRGFDVNFDMPIDLYKSIIDKLDCSKYGTNHVDLTGVGEPLLNADLVSMIEYAKSRGFKVSFTSNFTLLNKAKAVSLVDSGVDYLYASFDGSTKELFESIRVGSNFEKIVSNIELLQNVKGEKDVVRPNLRFYVTLLEDNLMDIQNIINYGEKLGVNGINFNRQIIPGKEHWESELPTKEHWSKLPDSNIYIGRRAIPLKRYQPCVALKGCYITYDGKVLPCNRLTQLVPRKEFIEHYIGDVNDISVKDVWFSRKYRLFRTKLALGSRPEYCKYCTHAYQF